MTDWRDSPADGLDIAVIAMAGRFPGARDVESFWENLQAGVESIRFYSADELIALGADPAVVGDPSYVKAGALLPDVDLFDAGFFGFSPREAEILDPQQRLFLECAWAALERAGYDSERYPGLIGVYAGSGTNEYLFFHLLPGLTDLHSVLPLAIGNEKDFLATRVSYELDLKGPSINVQTGCSSSLVGVHLACQALLAYQCDLALAGGVSLQLPSVPGYLYSPGGVLSPDGHCRAFSAAAQGAVAGSGLGIVVLKRLADALADGDTVHAVIKGSALNNDGASKIGYTAPSIEGQARVIDLAQAAAAVDPRTITYVEAHGSGTPLGDPIEVTALTRAFRAGTADRGFCALGSVKTNVGHLDTAAGMAGLIKAVLALQHRQIPPTLHFEQPNPQIDFADSPFFVNARLMDWPLGETLRRAGVSSFGIGGTNAHVILEEAPELEPGDPPARPPQLLVLSAKTPEALAAAAARLADHLEARDSKDSKDLADTAWTLQTGRQTFEHRGFAVARDPRSAVEALRDPSRTVAARCAAGRRSAVFLFPGLGDQAVDMAREIYEVEPVFREQVDLCAGKLAPHLGCDLREVLFSAGAWSPAAAHVRPEPDLRALLRRDVPDVHAAERLDQTVFAQPACFVVEHALARLLMAWGIEPEAMIGYSIGEYVAACLAGAFSLDDALALVARRARLLQELPPGALLAVPLSEPEIRPLLDGRLSLAATNGPYFCVVGGPEEAVAGLVARLSAQGTSCLRVQTTHAFHSAMMEPAAAPLTALASGIQARPPRIPYLSNVTGTWITAEDLADPTYWARHLQGTVRFAEGLGELLRQPGRVWVEVGPGGTLSTLVHQHPGAAAREADLATVPTLRRTGGSGSDLDDLVAAVGRLWSTGIEIDWERFHAGARRRRVPLPTYAFERRRFWIDPPASPRAGAPVAAGTPESIESIPAALRPAPAAADAAPGTDLERAVAGVWEELFGIAPIGAADNFFELGGHSLLAIQIMSRLRAVLGADLPVTVLFENPTVAGLARVLAESRGAAQGAQGESLEEFLARVEGLSAEEALEALDRPAAALAPQPPPPVRPVSGPTGVGDWPLSFDQERLLKLHLDVPELVSWNVDAVGRIAGPLDVSELLAAFSLIVRRHAAWRTAFPVVDGRRVQRVAPWLPPDVSVIDLTGLPPEMREPAGRHALFARTRAVYDLERGPLVRVALARLDADEHFCLIGVHHLVTDWITFQVCWSELLTICEAVRDGRPVSLPPPQVQFPDFVLWEREVLQGAELRRHAAFWRRTLDGFPRVLELPADRPRPAVQSQRGGFCLVSAGPERTERLRGLAHRQEMTMFMALLAVLDAVLHRFSGREKIVVGSNSANRPQPELESVFGLFLTQVPFAVDLSGDPTFRELLGRVRRTALAAYAHQNFPLSKLIEALGLEPDPRWSPVVQVLLLVLEGKSTTHAGGLDFHAMPLPDGNSRWDLNFGLYDYHDLGLYGPLEYNADVWEPATMDRLLELFYRLIDAVTEDPDVRLSELPAFSAAAERQALAVEPPVEPSVEDRLAGLGPAHRALLDKLLAEQAGAGRLAPPLVPAPRDGALPLSFAQQRLWFIDQLEPGSPLYNMPVALRVAGPLDGALLARCLGEIVRRHETLRTVFPLRDETPVQAIQPASPFVLPLIDLSGLPGLSDPTDRSDSRARQARLLAAEEAARPFDLAHGPLLRGFLLRLDENDHLLALTVHHIVSDGWSSGILVHEIQALYAAFAAGRPSPLPELPLQYADFAAWQRSWLQGEALESEVSFWRRQLAGLPPYLELPTDRPRPAIRSFRGAVLPFQLPAGLTRQARALGRREGATLFMALLAGFQVLLARYSSQQVLAVGTPTAGRNRVEIEGLIGFFVNTLVLRGDLTARAAGALSFREMLGRVRTTVLTAHEHQDVPFEKLVQELTPERSLTHSPLFQVMMTLQNFPSEGFALAGLSIAPVLLETASEKFDLELTFTEEGGGLSARLDYAGDLFDASTIRRMAGHLIALLEGAQAGPDRRLQDLPLLSAGERHQLQTEWNDTAGPSSTRNPGVVELFAAQVRRSPEALAVVPAGDMGEGLTYRELDRRADRLAGCLRAAGVRPETPVGLCVEHTPELVVGILGILKSGGAWLPLDPAHPRARLELLLEDAAVPVLVTQPHLLESLPSHSVQTVLLRGEEAEGEDGEDGELPASGHLAYLIYTSGTTGRPKAVQVEHGMLAATLAATQSRFRFGADDRMPCLALSTFDIVLFELLSPLLAGGTAVLFPRRPAPDVELLVDRLGELTCLHAVPALMREIVEALRRRGAGAPDVTKMRAVFVGGDAVPAGLLEDLRATFPAAQAWVLYGPTEGTIVCAAWPLPPLPPRPAPARSLLGRPLPGAVLHVCDGYGDLLPPGVAGELWIGGPGVTRGYLGRRELTADKYVPCGGGRLYRSGDRVRRLADGTLEFLGRVDHQVKVRGVRIEPGEIEAALAGLPGVREAVVVARAASDRSDRSVGSSDDRRLVAYVVGDATAGELRQGLRERLPDSMVPALFVTLPALPRSPNGKVDRAALPAPDAARPDAAREHVAPRTREEEILAAIWAQVLGLSRVGMTDNFFELGGDSILSIQIVARARQAGLHLTVRQMFEHQTVAGLALHATATSGATLSEQGPVTGEIPLTPVQRSFFEQGFADLHHFNQALVLEPREPLAPAALEHAVAAVVEQHDALRLRFGHGEAGWRQENAAAEPVPPFLRIDLSSLPASRFHEAFEAAATALQGGFDLATGPLTRLALCEAGAGLPGLLLWMAHHLVVDGVSWRILLEDLEAAYRQAARGLRPTLPPKTTSFQEWARRLAVHAGSAALTRELDHWREAAGTPMPRLPVDFPGGGENTVAQEASVTFELTADETAGLLQTVPSVYHNRIDEALLSALARALAGWTGSPRLRVDLEGHGREPVPGDAGDAGDTDDLDTSRTVGWLTTVYPVVLEAGDADPGNALVSTKERLRAVPGHGIGYGLLRASGEIPATAPAAEISFNYLGRLDAASGGLSLFRASTVPAGRSPRAHRTHLLEIGGVVAGGRLQITLAYGSRVHRRETAERLAAAYAGALRELIEHCRSSEGEVFTPSDFPKAGLDARTFGQVAALLDESDS